MNSAVLKINSILNQNIFLIEDKPVALNSEVMNYYSKPVVDIADRIFDTLESVFNDSFVLKVYGNKFEQVLFNTLSARYDLCDNCISAECEVNIPFNQRIKELGDVVNQIVADCELITDLKNIQLPVFEKVKFSQSGLNRIIVSNDLSFIHDNITVTDKIAFLVDGESTKKGKTIIIGCTADEINELIEDYICTTILNPQLGSYSTSIADSKDKRNLIFCTERYFYCDNIITIETQETVKLPIKSYPENAPLNELTAVARNGKVSINGLNITGVNSGNDVIELCYNSPIPFATVSVNIVEYNPVKEIILELDSDSDVLCAGEKYKLDVLLNPSNADDKDTLVIKTSNEDVAEYRDGYVYVKKSGKFSILANTTEANSTLSFVVKDKIESIKISEPPEKIYIGDVFEIKVKTFPQDAYNSKYKWISSDKSVAIVGMDKTGRELIKVTGVGEAEISCVSVDDESVCDSIKFFSDSTFNKERRKQTVLFFGVLACVAAFVFAIGGSGVPYWISFLASLGLLTYSYRKKESSTKAIFFIIATLISLLVMISFS